MCGIFGIVASSRSTIKKTQAKKITDALFSLSESRGKESSGLAVLSNNKITVCKAQQPASAFIQLPIYQQLIQSATPPFATIGHARLVTNGPAEKNRNNQPVIKNNIVGIHNGIITNDAALWKKFPSLKQRYEVDTEVFLSMTRYFLRQGLSAAQAVARAFHEIEGAASVALLFAEQNILLLATNTGSLYGAGGKNRNLFVFASERYILEQLLQDQQAEFGSHFKIQHIQPQTGCIVHIESAQAEPFDFSRPPGKTLEEKNFTITDVSPKEAEGDRVKKRIYLTKQSLLRFKKQYAENETAIRRLRRCTRCILPETMPFIIFDANGVCNYCRNYQKQKILGKAALEKEIHKYRRTDGRPDCIVAFSGGRDSSFALHYVKKVLGMNPVAYSYDWGMLTDLGRRNQARMCGALGVEHILVSADIKKKREHIRKNVLAWLKKPDMGTIPLFMAGDKQYFYYANKLRKQMDIDLVIYSENALEQTDFKYGFCGVRPKSTEGHLYDVGFTKKLQIAAYYGNAFLSNPAYINASLVDTITAYLASYFLPHEYVYLYRYIRWDEKQINSLLTKQYNWELEPDTTTTWRIGDGTAALYNYIYYTVAGFTEHDTFRSNQIRNSMLSRNQAMELVQKEHTPRYESIQWYCETIGIDINTLLRVIHSIPTLYGK